MTKSLRKVQQSNPTINYRFEELKVINKYAFSLNLKHYKIMNRFFFVTSEMSVQRFPKNKKHVSSTSLRLVGFD